MLTPATAEAKVLGAGFADAVRSAEAVGLNLAAPVISTLLPAGTSVLGQWAKGLHLYVRQGLTVKVARDHTDDFLRGRVAFAAEARLVSLVVRPGALQM